MTAKQYLALEYHIETRLMAIANDVRSQGLVVLSAEAWAALELQARYILRLEWDGMSQAEQDQVESDKRTMREYREHQARLDRELGRGAFGATWTGD